MMFQINQGILRRNTYESPLHGVGFSYPDDIRWIVISNDVISISDGAFRDCAHLRSIVIPDSVTWIGDGTFEGCASLKSIAIPHGVKEIRASLFKDCEALQSVSLPEGITRIGEHAFLRCKSLESIVIPDSVTEIAQSAFKGCAALARIDLPAGIDRISREVFNGCAALESIAIPDGIVEIGSAAFKGCTSIKSIVVPDGVVEIGSAAFKGCASLESIVIPDSVVEIGAGAFEDCAALAQVSFPASITGINEKVFCGCRSLTAFNIPEGVTRIDDRAFYNCQVLKSLSVPDNLLHWGHEVLSMVEIDELYITSKDGRYGAWRAEFTGPLSFYLREAVRIHTGDLASLPVSIIEPGLRAYAEDVAAEPAYRTAANHAFIAQNAASLVWLAFQMPKLLKLMCSDRLIGPETLPIYNTYAMCYCDDEALKAKIMACAGPDAEASVAEQTPDLAAGRKKVVARAAMLSRTDRFAGRVFALEHRKFLEPWPLGVNVLQPGKKLHFSLENVRTSAWPEAVDIVLRALDASIAPWVTDGVDVFVRTSAIVSPALLQAEALGVEIISGTEFLSRLSAIREISIPDNEERLDEYALYGMSSLERVELPVGLKALSVYAFDKTSVRMVIIPNATCKIIGYLDNKIVYLFPTAEQVTAYAEKKNVAYLGNIDDLPSKAKLAALRGFLRLEALGSDALRPWRDSYIRCARGSRKRQLDLVKDAAENIPLMLRLQMISAPSIPTIRDILEDMGDVEHLALLLDYETGLSPLAKQRAEESAERDFERRLLRMAESADRKANAHGIAGLTFVAAADLKHWDIYQAETEIGKRREALRAFIERRGGRLRSSVTGNTDYLIANDPLGEHTSCQRAREMEIEIISEEEFLHMTGVFEK